MNNYIHFIINFSFYILASGFLSPEATSDKSIKKYVISAEPGIL